jgi:hypothetical protein
MGASGMALKTTSSASPGVAWGNDPMAVAVHFGSIFTVSPPAVIIQSIPVKMTQRIVSFQRISSPSGWNKTRIFYASKQDKPEGSFRAVSSMGKI